MSKVKQSYTIKQFYLDYPDDNACLEKIYKLRFNGMTCCPKCGKKADFRRIPTRMAYQCKSCYHQLYPMAGTIFEKTRTPLTYWFFAIFLFTTSKNGLSACELQRHLGVTYKTAFRMLHQIRYLIQKDESTVNGVIEIDETFVGGKNGNRHRNKKVKNCQGRTGTDKTPVFGMIERHSRKIYTEVVPNAKGETLKPIIYRKIDLGATIMSDEYNAYNGLSRFYTHKACEHSKGRYVVDDCTTNRVENFWSCAKRSIKGSYIQISKKYMKNYFNEFEFRFNYKDSPSMFSDLLAFLPEAFSSEPRQNPHE